MLGQGLYIRLSTWRTPYRISLNAPNLFPSSVAISTLNLIYLGKTASRWIHWMMSLMPSVQLPQRQFLTHLNNKYKHPQTTDGSSYWSRTNEELYLCFAMSWSVEFFSHNLSRTCFSFMNRESRLFWNTNRAGYIIRLIMLSMICLSSCRRIII